MYKNKIPTGSLLGIFYCILLLLGIALVYLGILKPYVDIAGASPDWCIYILAMMLALLAVFPIIWPIIQYFQYGQTTRITRIKGFFQTQAMVSYFRQFWMGDEECKNLLENYQDTPNAQAEQALNTKFGDIIANAFGHDRYRQAMVYIVVLAVFVLFFAFAGGLQLSRGIQTPLKPPGLPFGLHIDIVSLAAIFGAYTWITSDVIYRYRQSDLASSDLYWYALRLIVAVPLGQAIAKTVPDNGALVSFVISMFSLSRIQQMLGYLINRFYPGVPATGNDTRDDITIKLPGIDQVIADRLAAEGVTTIAQLASIDPIFLSSRTGIAFQILLRYIDTAILWQYTGAKLLVLREYGLIGASDIILLACRYPEVHIFIDSKSLLGKAKADYQKASDEAKRTSVSGSLGNDNRDDLKAKMESAQADYNVASTHLTASSPPDLYKDIGAKADMSALALSELVIVLAGDDYAQFIRKMLQS